MAIKRHGIKLCAICQTLTATIWINATNAHGLVLDRIAVCQRCVDKDRGLIISALIMGHTTDPITGG